MLKKDLKRRRGETGRRTGLKIPRALAHESSILSAGTIKNKGLELLVVSFNLFYYANCA